MTTGKLVRDREFQISAAAGVDSIHNETGLSIVNLGEKDGYRLFYHDEDRKVKMLWYTDDDGWNDGGAISQDTAGGMALGSTIHDFKNITVPFPKNSENIELSRLDKSGLWTLGTPHDPVALVVLEKQWLTSNRRVPEQVPRTLY
jgi:hypothetical protein